MKQMVISKPEEVKLENGEEYKYTILPTTTQICKMIPYSIGTGTDESQSVMVWLCESLEKELFLISTVLTLESDLEMELIKTFPFFCSSKNIVDACAYMMFREYLPIYLVDFDCVPNRDENGNIIDFNFIGLKSNNTNDEERNIEEYRYFRVSKELYSCISLINNCIFEFDNNVHEIDCAIYNSFRGNNDIDIIFIDKVESLISMACGKKGTSLISAEFQVSFYPEKQSTEKQICTILSTFDLGVKFKKSKFKRNTIQAIEKRYLSDIDQYFTEFMFNTHLSDADKDYLVLRVKNKNGDIKLLFIDEAQQIILKNMISDF